MFEEYIKRAEVNEVRRAFALDCIIRLQGPRKMGLGTPSAGSVVGEYVKRAKVFEDYLAGAE